MAADNGRMTVHELFHAVRGIRPELRGLPTGMMIAIEEGVKAGRTLEEVVGEVIGAEVPANLR